MAVLDGALAPGSGTAVAFDCCDASPESGFCGPSEEAEGVAALPGLIGKSVWHFEHFSLAPPGGIRLSSML